jgi:hypothetical protein
MAKNIVPTLTAQELADLFRREAKIAPDGSVGFSRRGVARLVGKRLSTIQNLIKKISDRQTDSKSLQDFTGKQFEGDRIPDLLVSAIISYYARKGSDRCLDLMDLYAAVGLRSLVHKSQSWQTNQTRSDQIKFQYLLAEPRKWSAQFPDEFYDQLSRLTNIYPEGTNRPHFWANLTNEFVYAYLPSEIEEGVRQAKAANATNDKLHQFLKPDGLELLQNHLNALMVLMSGVSSIEELRKVSVGRFAGKYQLALKLV